MNRRSSTHRKRAFFLRRALRRVRRRCVDLGRRGGGRGRRRERPPRPRKRHVLGFRRRLVVGVFAHQVDVDGRRGVRWYQFGRALAFTHRLHERRVPRVVVRAQRAIVHREPVAPERHHVRLRRVRRRRRRVGGFFFRRRGGGRGFRRGGPQGPARTDERAPERGRPQTPAPVRVSRSSRVPSTAPCSRAPSSAARIRSAPAGFFRFVGSCTTEPDAAPRVPLRGLVVVVVPAAVRGLAEVTEAAHVALTGGARRARRARRARSGEAAAAATGAAPGPSGAPDPGAGSSDPGAPSPSPCSKNVSTAAATSPAADSRKKRALSASAHPVTVANSASLPSIVRGASF